MCQKWRDALSAQSFLLEEASGWLRHYEKLWKNLAPHQTGGCAVFVLELEAAVVGVVAGAACLQP